MKYSVWGALQSYIRQEGGGAGEHFITFYVRTLEAALFLIFSFIFLNMIWNISEQTYEKLICWTQILTSHLSELMRCPTFETDGTLVMRPYVTEEKGGSGIVAGMRWGLEVGVHFIDIL